VSTASADESLEISNGPFESSSSIQRKDGDTSIKQGAYGKVKIHQHSKLSQLKRIDEVFAVIKFLAFKNSDSGLRN